ncbi:hypothetical protein [Dactylosporangium matsuzakiense]|uniref:hypothetical protein n=1 Tax=Dactylosporangium matsuzakiense TaxID=53360 RepID=UPI0021C3AC2C|nr:hypothetical protein [Dactylosporangium matsuzakiense]UWZ43899.1 hypothetical protein Dmats_41860 [Dactylosporangium matsuzakiense]
MDDSESDHAELLKSTAHRALDLMRPDRPLWPAVEALAAALLNKPTMTYEDAAGSCPLILDT